MRGREGLVRSLDVRSRKFAEQAGAEAMAANYNRAFSLLSAPAAAQAFDLSQEPLRIRERYGMNRHGQSVLQARGSEIIHFTVSQQHQRRRDPVARDGEGAALSGGQRED